MKKLSIVSMLFLSMLFILPTTAAVAEEGVEKVVYHADFADPRRMSAMLG